MAKTIKIQYLGKELSVGEKTVAEKMVQLDNATAEQIQVLVPQMNIHSVRSTLARLEKTHGLLKADRVFNAQGRPCNSYSLIATEVTE